LLSIVLMTVSFTVSNGRFLSSIKVGGFFNDARAAHAYLFTVLVIADPRGLHTNMETGWRETLLAIMN
jgi:hypothetical protein